MEKTKQEVNKTIDKQKESIEKVKALIQNKETEDKIKERKQLLLNIKCKNYRLDHGQRIKRCKKKIIKNKQSNRMINEEEANNLPTEDSISSSITTEEDLSNCSSATSDESIIEIGKGEHSDNII